MYCTKCGHEISDDSKYCPFCGESTSSYEENVEQEVVGSKSGLKLAAFIIALITTIISGFAILPLIWCIPMTVKIYNSYKNGIKLSTAFSVCTLLFLNTISGILLLIDDNK